MHMPMPMTMALPSKLVLGPQARRIQLHSVRSEVSLWPGDFLL